MKAIKLQLGDKQVVVAGDKAYIRIAVQALVDDFTRDIHLYESSNRDIYLSDAISRSLISGEPVDITIEERKVNV
jgi:hypothetical protein